MKLIIQIPCYNEEETLEVALNALPKQIDGIDEIEYLIINDGSGPGMGRPPCCQLQKEQGACLRFYGGHR